MPDFIQSEYKSGDPITYNGSSITPFTRIFLINLPKLRGGLIWNRPYSILVTDSNGEEKILPVMDLTRRIIIYLFGMSAIFFIYSLLKSKQNNKTQERN